jgi:hypothetical protein
MRVDPERSPNYINHVAFVIDASSSMHPHTQSVIKVVDAEIAHLARRSQELDQETRVTVYTFADEVECLIYDKDVLRLPSIKDMYRPGGNTALIAATWLSQEDLEKTAQLYGDHAFLTYVVTDGQENVSEYCPVFGGSPRYRDGDWTHTSRRGAQSTSGLVRSLAVKLSHQADNWTVACLVPNATARHEAKSFGFPAENVAVWDTQARDGVEVAMSVVRAATESFMTNRTMGVRGSKTLFAGGADVVNTRNINASLGFRPLDKATYDLLPVLDGEDVEIRPFVVHATGQPYVAGSAYYELTKPEKIQPQKKILLRNRRSGRVYSGADARKLLNLPDHEVRVRPEDNAEFQIFVQSTSVNRKLVVGTKVLVLK